MVNDFNARGSLEFTIGTMAGTAERSQGAEAFQGEISFIVQPGTLGPELDLERLGIVGQGVTTRYGATGKISIQGSRGNGRLTRTATGWLCEAEVQARVLYRAIEQEMGFRVPEPGRYLPDFALYSGQIRAEMADPAPGSTASLVLSGSLHLTYEEGGLPWIPVLDMPLSGVPLRLEESRRLALAAAPCPQGREAKRRRLRLRPVFFSAGSQDPAPTGQSTVWSDLVAGARMIWGRCCLELDVLPAVTVDNRDLKNSSDPAAIHQSFEDPSADVIEVFLVDSDLPNGGGSTFSPGAGLAKIVITERSRNNPNLLVHEIGHVLNGLHPNSRPAPPSWLADPGTVLRPSGSASNRNPDRNTLRNCRRIDNAALGTLPQSGCIDPN